MMKLPNVEQAIVPQRKLTQYLLSPTHPAGRGKAAFFASFGFAQEAWETLADSLRKHALDYEVTATEVTPFGTSYTIEGALMTPDGRAPLVRVVWFIEIGDTIPRLVTAYPLKGATK